MRKTALQIIQEQKQLETEHTTARSLWSATQDYTCVQKSDYYNRFSNSISSKIQESWTNLYYLYDSVGVTQTLKLASSLATFLVNSKSKWFSLIPYNDEQRNDVNFRQALDGVTRRILEELDNTRFYKNINECLLDFSSIGNACFFMGEGIRDEILSFLSINVYDMYWAEDANGEVTSYWRKTPLTAYQIINMYLDPNKEINEKNVETDFSKSIWDAYKKSNMNQKFDIIHHVYPISHTALRSKNPRTPKFHSVHILDDEEGKILKETKTMQSPYGVMRGPKMAQLPYGMGQGTIALPNLKSQQRIAKATLLSAEKAVDPAMEVPANRRTIKKYSSNPGTLNPVDQKKGERIVPLTDFRYDIIFDFFFKHQQMIKEIFFDMELNITRGQYETAKAVAENSLSSLRVLQPIVSGLEKETLKPIVEFVTEELYKRREEYGLEEQFEILSDLKYRVRLTSEIAMVNKMKTIENFIRGLDVVQVLSTQEPKIKDRMNYINVLNSLWDLLDLPFNSFHDEETFQAISEAKQEALEEEIEMMKRDMRAKTDREEAKGARDMGEGLKAVSDTTREAEV